MTTNKTNEAINNIINWFEDNEEVFNEVIEELDNWNGYLGDDRYYYMDELDELYHDTPTVEILERAYYGYDEEYGQGSAFNPNRTYFTFNGYGNLVSADTKDYSGYLDEYFIEKISEERGHLYIDDEELEELLDQLEEAEEENEEA